MLCSDFQKFRTLPHEDKRQASQYNNCINAPLLNIQLDKISPPYLHILLGIILKHHHLLELAADDIDKTIYNTTTNTDQRIVASSVITAATGKH